MPNYKISTFRSEPDEKGIQRDVKTVVFASIAGSSEQDAAKEAFEKLTKWRKLPEIIPVKTNGRYTAFIRTSSGLESVSKVLTIVVEAEAVVSLPKASVAEPTPAEIDITPEEKIDAPKKRKGRKNNQ